MAWCWNNGPLLIHQALSMESPHARVLQYLQPLSLAKEILRTLDAGRITLQTSPTSLGTVPPARLASGA